MATRTVTTDTNVDDIVAGAWNSGDTLVINNGCTVTCSTTQTKFWGPITLTNGTLSIVNTSTTSGVIFALGRLTGVTQPGVTTGGGEATVDISGNWIEIGVGDGTASQTFNSPYSGGCAIAAVWIEETPGGGDYVPWLNVGGRCGQENLNILDPWTEVGSGDIGNFFYQGVNNSPDIIDSALIIASGDVTLSSNSIVCDSTDNLYPGASITGSGIPANAVVETVPSSTTFTISSNATVTASGNSYTCYNPLYPQMTNILYFGDGTQGNVIPSGSAVRVPNIMLTDFTPANVIGANASYSYNGGIVACTNTGQVKIQNCLMDDWHMSLTQATKVDMKYCGAFTIPMCAEIYDFSWDNIVFALPPDKKCYGMRTSARGSTQTNWTPYYTTYCWYPRLTKVGTPRQQTFSYLNNGSITNIYIVGVWTQTGVPGQGAAYAYAPYPFIDIGNTKNLTVDNIYGWGIWTSTADRCAISSAGYNNNCTFTNFHLYGLMTPVLDIADSDCIVSGVYMQGDYRDYRTYYSAAGYDRIPYDIATGEKLVTGTRYYFKTRSYRSNCDMSQYYESNEYCATPYRTNRISNIPYYHFTNTASGTVSFAMLARYPQGSAPCWEVYRGTTPGFTERDITTRMAYIASFATASTLTDGPVTEVVASATKTLTFNSAKTITRGGVSPGSWITDGYTVGKTIVVTGTAANDGTYTLGATAPTATIAYVKENLVTEGTYSATATVNGRAPVNDTTYYYVLRKYDSLYAVTNCSGVIGEFTISTTSNFNSVQAISTVYGTSGQYVLFNRGITAATCFSDLTIGMPVSGVGIGVGATIASVDDYSRITLSLPHTEDIDKGVAYFGLCSGMYVYCVTPFYGAGQRIMSVDSASGITCDIANPITFGGTVNFVGGEEYGEQEVTVRTPSTASNIVLYNEAFTNAAWVKTTMLVSGGVGATVGGLENVPYEGPFDRALTTYTLAEDTACKLIATGAAGKITQAVTTVSGTAYNASVWVQADLTTNIGPVSGWMSFGTASGLFVASGMWQQVNVNYTAISTSTNFVIGVDTASRYIYAASSMVTPGSSPKPAITTTSAAVTLNPCAQEINAVRVFGDSYNPDNGSVALGLVTPPVGTRWTDIFMSTVSGFAPSISNKIATTVANYNAVIGTQYSNNCTIMNVSGTNYNYSSYMFNGAKNCVVKDCYFDHTYCGLTPVPLRVDTNANDNLISNCYIDNMTDNVSANEPIIQGNNNDGLTIQNVRCNHGSLPGLSTALGIVTKGLTSCRGHNMNATIAYWLFGNLYNSPSLVSAAVYDTNFHEYYHTDTEGALFIAFNGSQSDTPPYTITGSGLFSNTGKFFFRGSGDAIEFIWPHRILGVSGFRNIPPKFNSLDIGTDITTAFGIYPEYAIDTSTYGTGYGAYKQLTRENLSSEVISPSGGFLFKVKLTARTGMKLIAGGTEFVVGETIRGATSDATAFVQDFEKTSYVVGATYAGSVNLTSISGTFTPAELIKTDDLVTTRATNVATNSLALYPQITSYVDGLEIYTYVDQTIMYPLEYYTLTLSNLISGTVVGFVEHGTETLLTAYVSWSDSDGNVTYTYPDTMIGNTIDIKYIPSGYMIQKIEYVLTGDDTTIPATLITDYAYTSGVADVTFDSANHRIVCDTETTEVSVINLYSTWKRWAMTSGNIRFYRAFNEIGGQDIDAGEGTSIPIYAYLYDTWRMRPQEASHTLNITEGVLLVEGGGDPFVNTAGSYIVRIKYEQPVQAICVSTGGGGGSTPAEIAVAVWDELLVGHITAGSAGLILQNIEAAGGYNPSGILATISGNILSLTNNLTTVSGIVNTNQSAIITISGNLLSMTNNLYTVSGVVTSIQNTLTVSSGDITTIKDNLITISGNILEVTNTLNTVSGDVTTINTTLNTVSGNLDTVNNTLITVSGDISTVNLTLNTVSGDIANMQNDVTNIDSATTAILNLTPTVFYVSEAGDDGNTGGYTNPLRTLDAANTAATAGDTIILLDGQILGFLVATDVTIENKKIISFGGWVEWGDGSASTLTLTECLVEGVRFYQPSAMMDTIIINGGKFLESSIDGTGYVTLGVGGPVRGLSLKDSEIIACEIIQDGQMIDCSIVGNKIRTLGNAYGGDIVFDGLSNYRFIVSNNVLDTVDGDIYIYGDTNQHPATFINNKYNCANLYLQGISGYVNNFGNGIVTGAPSGVNNEQWAKENTIVTISGDIAAIPLTDLTFVSGILVIISGNVGTPQDLNGGGASLAGNTYDIIDQLWYYGDKLVDMNVAFSGQMNTKIGTPTDMGVGANLSANLINIKSDTEQIWEDLITVSGDVSHIGMDTDWISGHLGESDAFASGILVVMSGVLSTISGDLYHTHVDVSESLTLLSGVTTVVANVDFTEILDAIEDVDDKTVIIDKNVDIIKAKVNKLPDDAASMDDLEDEFAKVKGEIRTTRSSILNRLPKINKEEEE